MNWKDNILPESFFDRNPADVARDLLGKYLVRKINGEFLVGIITETEAYLATGDTASHSFKGKTKRNASMYLKGGHAYVYSMRQYHLLNVATEGVDVPSAVLIRAIEPVEGIHGLINGPGKVCRELQITRELDSIDITDPQSELFITHRDENVMYSIKASTRIGISTAKEALLRFQIFIRKSA